MGSLRLSGVAGCLAALTVSAVMTSPALATEPVLALDAPCPGGGTMHASWSGVTPRSMIAILWARGNAGGLVIPQSFACAGTQTDLGRHHAQAVYIGPSGADGSGSIGRVVGPHACNGYMQAIDLGSCDLTQCLKVQP